MRPSAGSWPIRCPSWRPTRITFTLPLISAARRVLFLVSGAEKADMLRQVLAGPQEPERLPSQSVHPTAGNLIWLVDAPAYQAIEAETADA
ncbi:MAG: 6-phosphogluconolactonase [Caldilineaceae bacterium]